MKMSSHERQIIEFFDVRKRDFIHRQILRIVSSFSKWSRFFRDFAGRFRRRGFFLRGFDLENKFRRHVVMQFDWDLMFAGRLEWMLEHDAMAIDFVAELVLEPLHEILRGDGTERLAGFSGSRG